MRAVSLTRPWTELVLAGVKDVENRTWRTRATGWIIVHAARSWDPAAVELTRYLEGDGMLTAEDHANLDSCAMHKADADVGYLGAMRLTGCHRSDTLDCLAAGRDLRRGTDLGACSPWAFSGQWHWQISDVVRFAVPIPGRGRLGIFTPPPDVSDEIERVCPGIMPL